MMGLLALWASSSDSCKFCASEFLLDHLRLNKAHLLSLLIRYCFEREKVSYCSNLQVEFWRSGHVILQLPLQAEYFQPGNAQIYVFDPTDLSCYFNEVVGC